MFDRENGELESKSEVKKRIAAEKKEKLKQEKEAARLKKEAAEKAAREAADVVSFGLVQQRRSFLLTTSIHRTTLPTSTASSPSSSRPRGLVSGLPVLESNDLSR